MFSAEDQLKAIGALLDKAEITGIAANFIRLVAAEAPAVRDRRDDRRLRQAVGQGPGPHPRHRHQRHPLSDEHVAELKESLKAISGGRDVELAIKLDPSIIGGLIVQLGSRMVDGSLKTKLNAIRTRMKEVG